MLPTECPLEWQLISQSQILFVFTYEFFHHVFFSTLLRRCTGFGWEGVNFLRSSYCGSELCVCGGNTIASSGVF